MQPNEHVVRQFAYQIWESEGKPEGQAARHWDMACKLAAGEMGPADPFEPLSNIDTYAVAPNDGDSVQAPGSLASNVPSKTRKKSAGDDPAGAPQVNASMDSAAPAKASRSRSKVKALIDDPEVAPKKRASRSTKKPQQAT